MPYATLTEAEIYYEQTGPADAAPLILINGWGSQLIAWHPEFVRGLADAGFHVTCFDNRDTGLSSKFADRPPYSMSDMARDVADLIAHLGFGSAHITGQSMGGMIAQQLAIEFPERVRSLCSICSAPSIDFVVRDPEVWDRLQPPPVGTREDAIEQFLIRERLSGTNGFDGQMRELAARVYDRCYCPDGVDRQKTAIDAAPDRRDALATLRIAASVIHGRADRLIPISAGLATAEAIPGAELHLFPDIGHEIARPFWPDIIRIVVRTAGRADQCAAETVEV